MFNYDKLYGRIREKKYTQEQLAKELDINTSTLNVKLNNQSFFTQEEIKKIVELLDIKPNEICDYFFTLKV